VGRSGSGRCCIVKSRPETSSRRGDSSDLLRPAPPSPLGRRGAPRHLNQDPPRRRRRRVRPAVRWCAMGREVGAGTKLKFTRKSQNRKCKSPVFSRGAIAAPKKYARLACRTKAVPSRY
jgi:hypothetical protein